jgi:3-dehydroquinate dehydratase-1
MVELRLDLMQIDEVEISQLLKRGVPAVVTCREGVYDQARRQQLLLFAIDNGAAYVDVEIEADEGYRKAIVEHAKEKNCKVIISYHNFENTPSSNELKDIISKSRNMGADIVKLITTAKNFNDNARVLSLYENEQDLICFAMGEVGKITRFACLFLGAPFTYASVSCGKEAAPGQLAVKDIESMLRIMNN